MDIGSILVGLAVLLVAAFLISQPLLDQRQRREHKVTEADRLREQRDRIVLTLRDLDFDHASGKLPEEDYTALRAKLVADGAAVLKQLDDLKPARSDNRLEKAIAARRQRSAPEPVDDLEAAIAARRRGTAPVTAAPAEDDVEQAIAARRRARPAADSKEVIYCTQCGQSALAGDKFCAKCGAKLPGALSTKDSA